MTIHHMKLCRMDLPSSELQQLYSSLSLLPIWHLAALPMTFGWFIALSPSQHPPRHTHTHTFSRCWSNKSISLLLLSRHHLPAHLIRYNPLHIKNLLSAANLNTHSLHIILTIEINGTCCVLHVWSAGVKERVGSLFISTRVASLGLHQQQGEERWPVPAFFPSTL